MRSADIPESAANSPAPNGTHQSAKGKGKMSASAPETAPPDARFLPVQAAPVDAPMWPILPSAWLQPELRPLPPSWSGLVTEHHHRIPVPGFWPAEMVAADLPAVPERSRDAMDFRVVPRIPESGLDPLGWDPRAFAAKEKSK